MKNRIIFLALVCILSLSLIGQTVKSQALGTIYIRSDGAVEGTDKVQRNENIYNFIDDVYALIVVERDNIIVEGAGYSLQPGETGDKAVGVDLRDRNNVSVRNLEIAGFVGRCGILLLNSNYCNISRNIFTKNNIGVEMTLRSSRNGIVENRFENNLLGLDLSSIDPGSDNIISDNEITDNTNVGMVIKDFVNSRVLNNNFLRNEYALFVGAGEGSKFRNNTLNDNTYGFGAFNVKGVDVDTSNTVNGKAIYYWVNQHDKTIPADAGYVALISCTGITVKNLNLAGNFEAISLGSTTNSTIIDNKLSNNVFGVSLEASFNNNVSLNVIINNQNGVELKAGSSNNTIQGNSITANDNGVFIDDAAGNTITKNNIANSEIGVYTQYCGINTIHHNNFINNTKNWNDAALAPFMFLPLVSVSMWDDGEEGNFWSDYNGTDTDNNGIGDTPYQIGTNNTDHYPLMKPVSIPECPDGLGETELFPFV